jgi:hypothetical protein
VTVLSRRPDEARRQLGVEALGWQPESEPAPVAGLAGRDAVVHLAGEPIGLGLLPFAGTPGFEDRAPSYQVLVFEYATGVFIGTQHLLRRDIYERGKPPCPQQQGGEYVYNMRNDLYSCLRT